tara:strand:+ start:710 stop:1519 length:810 start_codon:yes stop_codon:yes gene_type:complete
MNESVTVILNGFKRNHTLREQVEAVSNQTKKVDTIMYWQNTSPDTQYDLNSLVEKNSHISISNTNYGVWARFAHALNAKTDYVCVIDDDTIPGDMWIENCIETYRSGYTGVLGTIGLLFQDKGYNLRGAEDRLGWHTNIEEVRQVDIVGHNWFFHRDMLSYFWRELPSIEQQMIVGEDIHFSHMLQKYSTEHATWVPPHPADNKRMWGSLKAMEYGSDQFATANQGVPLMGEYLNRCIEDGFMLLSDEPKVDINGNVMSAKRSPSHEKV